MQLRANQEIAVDKVFGSIKKRNNTLLVAPTGFGKTITMAGIASRSLAEGAKKVVILQHRDELLYQNLQKFQAFSKGQISTSVFNGEKKSFRGKVSFPMVQTLCKNLERIPHIDHFLIDEAHHSPTPSYLSIIEKAREINPEMKLIGVTATPVRGDRKTLNATFDNVCHVVKIGDLIANGYLVPPITFKPQVGDVRQRLGELTHSEGHDFNMDEASSIMNKTVITEEVIRHWKEKAGNRKTIVFCTNIAHAKDVLDCFRKAGVSSDLITSRMKMGTTKNPAPGTRRYVLQSFAKNEFQVLINVMVLTEGFDDQRVSCVVILRPAAYKATFIQIVGRGLRKVDQSLFPGTIKTDCIVLDFCSSHSDLEQDANEAIIERLKRTVELQDKPCPKCAADLPARARECYICGFEFEINRIEREEVENVELIEVNLLSSSKLPWIDLFNNGLTLMASGFKSWACILRARGKDDIWAAFGAKADSNGLMETPKILDIGSRIQTLAAAQDWVGLHEVGTKAKKNKSWITEPPSSSQVQYLERFGRFENVKGMNKYAVACRIQYMKNEPLIIHLVKENITERAVA